MELLNKQIREELLARIERDPSAIAICNTSTRTTCITIVAVVVAFGCGFAIGAWWFA